MSDAQRQNLLELDREGLERFFVETLDEKRFRAHQVMKWIHHRYATEFADMTDLGKALRAKLEARAVIRAPQVVFDKASADGTHKWLLGMDAKNAIETVYIPDKGRGTLCVSSQVGCTLNCSFCHTGTMRLVRNLEPGEIVGQVMLARDSLGEWPSAPEGRMLTNIVMMGMGEPLMNFDNVVRAMSVMRDDLGYGLANKRVTLSTAGMVPQIDRLAAESDVSLAVSLRSASRGVSGASAARRSMPTVCIIDWPSFSGTYWAESCANFAIRPWAPPWASMPTASTRRPTALPGTPSRSWALSLRSVISPSLFTAITPSLMLCSSASR